MDGKILPCFHREQTRLTSLGHSTVKKCTFKKKCNHLPEETTMQFHATDAYNQILCNYFYVANSKTSNKKAK